MFDIYKITSPSTDNIYIGSTNRSGINRFDEHLYNYKRYQQGKGNYCTSYEILKHNDCNIDLCVMGVDSTMMKQLERYFIEKYKKEGIAVNKNIPNRTPKEYYEDNKDIILKHNKEYFQINRESIRQYYKKDMTKERLNKKFNCQCGGHYTYVNKYTHLKSKRHQKSLS